MLHRRGTPGRRPSPPLAAHDDPPHLPRRDPVPPAKLVLFVMVRPLPFVSVARGACARSPVPGSSWEMGWVKFLLGHWHRSLGRSEHGASSLKHDFG